MFEALGTLRNLKPGMVVDGPNKGDAYYAHHLHIIELPKHEDVTASYDPCPPVAPSTFKVTDYHKCDYFIYGERHYVWSIHNPEYWRNK